MGGALATGLQWGTQASEELEKLASVSDLAFYSRKMRVIPALPAECQVEALRRLWRSLYRVAAGTELIAPHEPNDRLILIVRGEVQAVLGQSDFIPLLPEGSFLCESFLLRDDDGRGDIAASASKRQRSHVWMFRGGRRSLPSPALALVDDFLTGIVRRGPQLHGRVRATRPSLIAELTRTDFLECLDKAEDAYAARSFRDMPVSWNMLQNVRTFGAEARALGAVDINALRIVCEGPTHMSCQGVTPALRAAVPNGLFGGCMQPPQLIS
jgi:CRP-like cAMP-binding protein